MDASRDICKIVLINFPSNATWKYYIVHNNYSAKRKILLDTSYTKIKKIVL